ncbi:MAG TPA: peptidoglycan editing factor PgeF [Drouetiella sp.]
MSKTLERALNKNSWLTVEIDGLTLNQSPLLAKQANLVHAFTTRHGGDSPAPVDTFNVGRHLDTDESRLDAANNRRKLCQALGLNWERLAVPGQVHSSIVVIADDKNTYKEVDGIATSELNRPVLLHFADCVPVIIFDTRKKVLCIVHAGWRGTAGSIAKNGVKLMTESFGSKPADIVAAVGPAIGSCCYPTGAEVSTKLAETVSRIDDLVTYRDGIPHPDLKAVNAMQLLESGVAEVDVTDICTCCHPELFYSHRQSGGKTGRQGAIGSIIN